MTLQIWPTIKDGGPQQMTAIGDREADQLDPPLTTSRLEDPSSQAAGHTAAWSNEGPTGIQTGPTKDPIGTTRGPTGPGMDPAGTTGTTVEPVRTTETTVLPTGTTVKAPWPNY